MLLARWNKKQSKRCSSIIMKICRPRINFTRRSNFGSICGVAQTVGQILCLTPWQIERHAQLYFPTSPKFTNLLLISVTSCGVERAIFSLKFIKNSLCSTMGKDRFNALVLLFVHKNIELKKDKIIVMHARKHSRRMLLLNPLSYNKRH